MNDFMRISLVYSQIKRPQLHSILIEMQKAPHGIVTCGARGKEFKHGIDLWDNKFDFLTFKFLEGLFRREPRYSFRLAESIVIFINIRPFIHFKGVCRFTIFDLG